MPCISGQHARHIPMTKPSYYPCLIVKMTNTCFYIIPILFAKKASDIPASVPNVFRLLNVIPTLSWINYWSVRSKLLDMLRQEADFLQSDCCLVLGEDCCYFYSLEKAEFRKSRKVPRTSFWLPDSFYFNVMAGQPEEREEMAVEQLRLRIYCPDINKLQLGLIQAVYRLRYTPSIIQLHRRGISISSMIEKISNWINRTK